MAGSKKSSSVHLGPPHRTLDGGSSEWEPSRITPGRCTTGSIKEAMFFLQRMLSLHNPGLSPHKSEIQGDPNEVSVACFSRYMPWLSRLRIVRDGVVGSHRINCPELTVADGLSGEDWTSPL
jgi:hypothetical protein